MEYQVGSSGQKKITEIKNLMQMYLKLFSVCSCKVELIAKVCLGTTSTDSPTERIISLRVICERITSERINT
jgi:hypothetical protein